MITWEVILLVVLLVGFIGVSWFFTIKDMVKHYRYLESQKKTNRAYNNDCYNSDYFLGIVNEGIDIY